MCHKVPESERIRLATLYWFWDDCGGLSKRIWFNQYQIFQTLLTHNTHKSQKTDPLFKVTGRMLWNLPVTELAYSKQVYTKDIHFQGIVASGSVLQS